MTNAACRNAEVLAGAIALGEASDAQRQTYRKHVSTCGACLRAHGGEREIERTMAVVAQARSEETWEPDIAASLRDRMNVRKRAMKVGFSALAACFAASLAIHFIAVSGLSKLTPTLSDPLVIHYDGQKITLERRSVASRPVPTATPRVTMVVVHNVVTLTQPSQRTVARATVHQPTAAKPATRKEPDTKAVADAAVPSSSGGGTGNVPIWRQGGGAFTTVAHSHTTSVVESLPRSQAESIQIASAYTVQEPAPVGGESAINPQPLAIAYAEGAEGTTVFEVQIDARGIPTKCIITSSSGFLSLDSSVCKAAMKVRYTPKLVNGRPQPGTYRDAFTFRNSGANEGL